jgi:hypothetical protein
MSRPVGRSESMLPTQEIACSSDVARERALGGALSRSFPERRKKRACPWQLFRSSNCAPAFAAAGTVGAGWACDDGRHDLSARGFESIGRTHRHAAAGYPERWTAASLRSRRAKWLHLDNRRARSPLGAASLSTRDTVSRSKLCLDGYWRRELCQADEHQTDLFWPCVAVATRVVMSFEFHLQPVKMVRGADVPP